jgi:aspartate 1-decarboxylase
LNGAVAHLGGIGDKVTIMSFTEVDASQARGWEPQVIVLGEKNLVVDARGK